MKEIKEDITFYVMVIGAFIVGILVGARRILTIEIGDTETEDNGKIILQFGAINVNVLNADDNSRNVPEDNE